MNISGAQDDSHPANSGNGAGAGSGTSSSLENIKVAVRLRPFTDKEKQRNSQRIVDIEQNTVVLYNPKSSDANLKKFTFDYSYWSHDGFKRDERGLNVPDETHPNWPKYVSQERVFEDLGHFLLENALNGYNSALLAYGQTGSGKSYTVSGYGQNEGILPRFARALFEQLDERAALAGAATALDDSLPPLEPSEAPKTQPEPEEATQKREEKPYEVFFSMLEIYNEVVRDLLANNASLTLGRVSSLVRRGLKVREHPKRGFFVENLTSISCSNRTELERRIEEGQLNKSIAATSMNEASSRGHTIYEFRIRQHAGPAHAAVITTSVVQLVDLAGSERMVVHLAGDVGVPVGPSSSVSRSSSPVAHHRATVTAGRARRPHDDGLVSAGTSAGSVRRPTGAAAAGAAVGAGSASHTSGGQHQRFKESISINQSLSALGNCIQVLSQYSQQQQQFETISSGSSKPIPKIPYRDSVLTKLLNRCCLGGNSKVVIIATLSPADANYDDTLSTLRFADRAKQIRTHATVNRLSRPQMVDALQKENERLKQMIDGRLTRSDDSSQTSNFDDTENMLENFAGPAATTEPVPPATPSGRPTRAVTRRRARTDDRKSRRAASQIPASEQLRQIISPKAQKMAASGRNIAKSRSLGRQDQSLAAKRATSSSNATIVANSEDDDVDQATDLEPAGSGHVDDDDDDHQSVSLVEPKELADIEEAGLMSSDSEDSFGLLADEALSEDEKIALFNRLLSNSKVATRIGHADASPSKSPMSRPKRSSRHQAIGNSDASGVGGIKNIAMLSSSLKRTNPYLSNLNQDEQLTGMISYILKVGETSIGKSQEADIVLHGPEIQPIHAKILRVPNESDQNGQPKSTSVFIEPVLAQSKDKTSEQKLALLLNGSQVTNRIKLNHCDRLLFGSNVYFVFIDNSDSEGSNHGDTIANLDLVTFDMARSEVLRKIMAEEKHEAVINEINHYTHRPGTGKFRSNIAASEDTKDKKRAPSLDEKSRLIRTETIHHSKEDTIIGTNEISNATATKTTKVATPNHFNDTTSSNENNKSSEQTNSNDPATINELGTDDDDNNDHSIVANYRDRLMEDTYEYALPVAEVNAIAKEMSIKVSYGLKILTGEEQLTDQQYSISLPDSNASDVLSSSSLGDGNESDKIKNSDQLIMSATGDQVTKLTKLDSLDIPPALFIQVHLEEMGIDFYWSKEKFQARRYKILELYGAWDVGGKSALVEYLIDQSKIEGDYLIDPFIDDPNSTLVLIGHAQITLQPISHLSDMENNFDIIDCEDETIGDITIQAIPCHPTKLTPPVNNESSINNEPYRVFNEQEIADNILENPNDLLDKKLVFLLKITSCQNIPEQYGNVFCQYTLNRDRPIIRTNIQREDSLDGETNGDKPTNGDDNNNTSSNNTKLTFNHSHYICFDKVNNDVLDFLQHGFLTIQLVGQYKTMNERVDRSPTVISTIISSINKFKYKIDQQNSYNFSSFAPYENSNTDSAKSHRNPSSGIMNSNSGPSSVASTSTTVNLFDQQNDDDEGNNSMNGLSQENIIDMILTKRKLDRAENQLHYLKRTINIAEHYNKKHIPVKTVKKLLNSYGHELDSGSLEEMASDVAVKGRTANNKNSGCSIQ